MAADTDPHYYDRADALIELANAQLAGAAREPIEDSFMYALARFNAWSSACGEGSAERMAAARAQTVAACVEHYRHLLEASLEDYIAHYDAYMKSARR
ncbi:MAG TPA: DUF3144 domain-containing protein [Stenotrophomonas sp.]|nr:DUF3144 domain-containing protein [Stenotrophomonas sp.]